MRILNVLIILIMFFNAEALENSLLKEYKSGKINGVSLPQLLVTPAGYDSSSVKVTGYLNIIEDGIYKGLWLSLFPEGDDILSSVKIVLEKDGPQINWLQEGRLYSVTGEFINCLGKSCTKTIKTFKGGILPKN